MNLINFLKSLNISGNFVLPIIEGGKGIGVSSGVTAGHFAAAGAVGTFSGANPPYINEHGEFEPIEYKTSTRFSKHNELIEYSIRAGIRQAEIAHEIAGGKGRIHMNILWEMGGATKVLEGILEGAKGIIHGITAGAGMPYSMGEIAEKFGVYYYPIVSSARAFRALWQRAYRKFPKFLGGIVYEDPWLAGGHNGLSTKEDPNIPQDPEGRVIELRAMMKDVGLAKIPIIMAGGVWNLSEWGNFIQNDDIAPIAFQFGTRPLLTRESPISDAWKKRLLTIKKGDVALNRFSPTGFYSSAFNNNFIQTLYQRSERQIPFSREKTSELNVEFKTPGRGRIVYLTIDGKKLAEDWMSKGFDETLPTPSSTMIFVNEEEKFQILKDQKDCMGCLSHCAFSNWKEYGDHTTGLLADPRSYCIQKTLQAVISNGDLENELMFSGHNAYKFGQDSFYANGFIPTIKELVDRIMSGQ